MKSRRFILVAIFSVVALSGVGIFASVHAESQSPMSQAHVDRIRTNCIDAQSSLSRLHASDALLRVNRGQLYESILTKLMSPFNNRVTSNQLDSTALVAAAVNFDHELNQFRTSYISYEESLSAALSINCMDQPVAFYDTVADARAKRQIVHDLAKSLETLITTYQSSFEDLAGTIEGNK